jgi:seryl-tRNA synthetase
LNIRYKDGAERDFVHTISATAATDRMIICILENFQQPDGSIIVPEVLRPYTGFDRIEARKK